MYKMVSDDYTTTTATTTTTTLSNKTQRLNSASWQRLRQKILRRDNFTCAHCRIKHKKNRRILTVDHIIPLSDGGPNSHYNLRTLCKICHRKRNGEGHYKNWSVQKIQMWGLNHGGTFQNDDDDDNEN